MPVKAKASKPIVIVPDDTPQVFLSQDEKDAIIEEYLGVHPKHLLFTNNEVTVDLWKLEHDGKRFDGFMPYRKSVGAV